MTKKQIVETTYAPILLAILYFTTGSDGLWDGFLAFMVGLICTLLMFHSIFSFYTSAIWRQAISNMNDLQLTKVYKMAQGVATAPLAWHFYLLGVLTPIAWVFVLNSIGWTKLMWFYAIAYGSMHVGRYVYKTVATQLVNDIDRRQIELI